MQTTDLARVESLHGRLLRVAQTWASHKPYDAGAAADLRREALLLNHRHYLANIPAYGAFAREAGVGEVTDLATIKSELLSTDDIFKSYDPAWLDARRFDKMNEWLGRIYHARVRFDVAGITTIDGWIEALIAHGVRPIYSSGSSGRFSFVPRDPVSWNRFAIAPSAYIAPMVLQLGVASALQRLLLPAAMKYLDPFTLAGLVQKRGMPGFDGVFLAFRGGHMGTQVFAQKMASQCDKNTFLYDFPLAASTLRLLASPSRSPAEDRTVADFRDATIVRKEANYARVIAALKDAARRDQRVFMAGAPYLFKELLEALGRDAGRIPLAKGSVVMTGGGWKTFSGEKIEQGLLGDMIADAFVLPVANVIDGYSMAEIHGVVPRCAHGRYHLPPMIEPMVVDENLRPVEGKDVTGTFAFMDPFAVSYPGFIVSGDRVRMVDAQCACGTWGPAFTEIGRAAGREVKGCGGVMASIQA